MRSTTPRLGAVSLILLLWSAPVLARTHHRSPPPHNPACTLTSFLPRWREVPDGVYSELAPEGVLKIGVNYGNPNNASIDANGSLRGVAVDLGCILARRLGLEVEFVPYAGIPAMMQGFDSGEWSLGFTFDPQFGPQTFAYAHPHLAVENTYLVPGASPFKSVADVDQAGVLISVAQGNSPDIYLSGQLKNATLVRFATVPQALAALKNGQVDAFAGSRTAEIGFLSQMPNARLLPDDFLLAQLAAVTAMGADEAVGVVNRFVEESKVHFLIQLAIARSGLVGVLLPAPVRESDDDRR
jgi:polar amino acid transport system substrate-binding protein